jgi:flagellar M-ring protein FliF
MAELQTLETPELKVTQQAGASAGKERGEEASMAAPKLPFAMPKPKRGVMIAMIFAAVIGLGLITMSFIKPKYQVLYTGLDQSDAAAISSYLQKAKIEFKISENGEVISVLNISVPKLRLELASKGMPRGNGVGFEIFDKTNLTVTDFSQKLNYVRALEGELSRTITSLDTVKAAKVHLALAKKSIFKEQQERSTASVIITPAPNQELTMEQVKGIRHLVASAVPDLDPADVQITDSSGQSLVSMLDDEESLQSQQMARNEDKITLYEKDLERNLHTMLLPILGDQNVLVNVEAEMNFDESQVDVELFSPTGADGTKAEPVVRSEKVISEKYSKGNGFLGASKNANNDKDYQKDDATRNYEVSRSVEHIKKATGILKRVSVAVVVNKDLSPSERATLRETVVVAAGLNLERGDQVAITGIRFSSAPHLDRENKRIAKAEEEGARAAMIKKYVALAFSIFIALIAVGLLLMSLRAPIDTNQARKLEELLSEEEIPLLTSINEKLKEAEEAFHRKLSTDGKPTLSQMKRELSKLSYEEPEKIARGLKTYLQEV